MGWFNYYGLAIMAVILFPNLLFAVKHREGFENLYRNKGVEIAEQIGRYGCFIFMIFNIPYAYHGFWFGGALAVYLSVNGALCLAYCLCWAVIKEGVAKSLCLSIIPSVLFLFSGITVASAPLTAFAVAFAAGHITISYKNAAAKKKTNRENTYKGE